VFCFTISFRACPVMAVITANQPRVEMIRQAVGTRCPILSPKTYFPNITAGSPVLVPKYPPSTIRQPTARFPKKFMENASYQLKVGIKTAPIIKEGTQRLMPDQINSRSAQETFLSWNGIGFREWSSIFFTTLLK